MPHNTHSTASEAQERREAVKMFRAGHSAPAIAEAVHRSRRWVYSWVAYQRQHPHTRFRSASRAPRHHPNQVSRQTAYRIVQLRHTLTHQRQARLRYAPVGARTIRRELEKRRVKPCPSLSTIQRILQRHGLTQPPHAATRSYRPHPPATYPNAVQATDIVTRWLTGGEVVQTFTTVDHFTNTASATPQPHKRARAAREHLLNTWQKMGLPDVAQFDNESAFSGGRQPHRLGPIVRLCLYVGSQVLFTPEYEADYNWVVETFNNFWAHQCWAKHRFTSRGRIPLVCQRFLAWYDTDYVAPRQTDTPQQLRKGHRLSPLPHRLAQHIPQALPLCRGRVHAIRCVSAEGTVKFLQEAFRVGKRYSGKYVWLTLNTAKQTLTAYYQAEAEADWQTLKVFPYPLEEPVVPVLKQFARLHAHRAVCRMC
jgi:putative transposase